jgi:hypothetical protein
MADDNALTDMIDNDALALLNTTDAQVWAREFCARFTMFDLDGESVEDETGLMIAWFANAIETGRMAGLRAPRSFPGPCVVTEL